MSTLYNDPDLALDNQNTISEPSGAAYDDSTEGGVSIMPPDSQFSTEPLETGGMIPENEEQAPETDGQKEEKGKWTTPREHEEIDSKRKAMFKIHQVKVHINYLLDLWDKSDKLKKPANLEELVNLTGDCDDIMKFLGEGIQDNPDLTSYEAEELNRLSTGVEISYADVFGVIIGSSRDAAENIRNIPDMDGLSDALKELIRQKFGDKDQAELDHLMYTLKGTETYHKIIARLKKAAWNAAGSAGNQMWAEGLKAVESSLGEALKEFRSKSEYIVSFVTGLFDIFSIDDSDSIDGMRKTFDFVGTIIDNPFVKGLAPLWTVYKPAINFCMDGIAKIDKQRKENFKPIGDANNLPRKVKNNEQDKINISMTLSLPGVSELGCQQLLFFMMDIHSKPILEAVNTEVHPTVQKFFEANLDLLNAGGEERIKTDYNNPLNPWDNELADIADNAWSNRKIIWTMLYGTLLTAPKRS